MITSENQPIRVMVVDDHIIVREGIASILETFPDLQMVAEAKNGLEALETARKLRPDVILMDLSMPEMGGIEATRKIKGIHEQTQILALTSFTENELVQGVLEAGAIGYLLKNVSADELAQAIRDAFNAEPTLAPEATQSLLNAISSPKPDYGLTKRELEVLQEIVHGKMNEQIAQTLNITVSTVKNHVSSILNKLDVTTRTAAAYKATREKLVTGK